VKNTSLIIDCDDVDSNYWNYNKDDKNWLCSGQGRSDLQVSSTSSSQSIFANIASNIHGIFQLIWQTRRDGNYQIYGATWDSKIDHLHSSGQGEYDKLKLVKGYDPIIFSDHANNFYITGYATEEDVNGNTKNDIYINACPTPVGEITSPVETTVSEFAKFCGPGINTYLDSSFDQIKIRIREEDIAGSLVINSGKAVPVINKKSINIDIDGIPGSYAVRLRNINDSDWGGWINIDNNLYYSGEEDDFITPDDVSYNAYRIDNSRFIVPWDVYKNNE